jgi:uncharacterized protein (TIGR00299 family) protein
MHIHLDAVGGISGNMFIGAMLDLWPVHAGRLPQLLKEAGFANMVTMAVTPKNDGVLSGTYVDVSERMQTVTVPNPAAPAHTHRSWREIRRVLEESALDAPVKKHALGIFGELARAEASVHGKAIDAVEFHEVGAWDSIADIVCAAYLIDVSGAGSWSVSSLPLGRGRIDTSHGLLPVPAPAVTLLLKGFSFHDDGRHGERVTPTGAAILRHLGARQDSWPSSLTLQGSGYGFGSRTLAGMSNILRAMAFAATGDALSPRQDQVSILSFEVDDQSPEDLALALDLLRNHAGVLDVVHSVAYGKKHRLCSSVRVMALPEAEAEVTRQCFGQTTTLGIRHKQCRRSILERKIDTVMLDGTPYRVKLALRPGGEYTAKAELDDLSNSGLDQGERQLIREAVEAIALERQYAAAAPATGVGSDGRNRSDKHEN